MKIDVQQIKQRFGIIGNGPELNCTIDIVFRVAPTDLSVLIIEEGGVGKETSPQIVHQNSQRKHGQYVTINCGTIPKGTMGSELFGHEEGSFTGALADRKGYFEVADDGAVFLDGVGESPTPTRARLFRMLETGEFIKVDSSKVQKTGVCAAAATNVNLVQAASEDRFREGLYYRLSTVLTQMPPSQGRPEGIVLLFRKFTSDCAEKYRMPSIHLNGEAHQLLVSYRWPGSVRELKNITERISAIEKTRDITADVLHLYLPNMNVEKYPVLVRQDPDQKIFNSGREILYQVLPDMKENVSELRKLAYDIMRGDIPVSAMMDDTPYTRPIRPTAVHAMHPAVQDVEDVEEEILSSKEVEKEMIHKALEKCGERRKNAAVDLKILEHTLYQRIREYNLE